MRRGFLFPGQGSQSVGMGRSLAQAYPSAKALYDEASEILGWDFIGTVWDGPEDELLRTDRTQPAIYVASAAAFTVLSENDIRPTIVAGHSVGEYAALFAAGALSFEEGLRLVKARSEAMQEASLQKKGGMVALLGMDEDGAEEVCEDVRKESAAGITVEVANLNSPGQVVISGEEAALDLASRLARMRGALKCIPLAVSGAWHSSLMKPAEEMLAPVIERAPVKDASVPVIVNVSAEQVTRAGELKECLVRQVCGAVRWEQSMRRILDEVDEIYEVGHGRVLAGIMKRIDRRRKVFPVGEPEDLEKLSG